VATTDEMGQDMGEDDRSTGTGPAVPQQLHTVAEVADALRVSTMTVYRLVQSGDLPALRVGRAIRIPADGLGAYLASSEVVNHQQEG
jgi:excisionase family DNA binding protein